MNKDKIVYLLGAGASAKAFPARNNNGSFTNSINALGNILYTAKKATTADEKIVFDYRSEMMEDLFWLAKNGDDYGSVDSFAAYCSNPHTYKIEDLRRIKKALNFFFSYYQFVNRTPVEIENRYRNFIAHVGANSLFFPENIRILSWNYDFLFQLASDRILKENFRLPTRGGSVKRRPYLPYYPPLGYVDGEIPALLHINGIAGYYSSLDHHHILSDFCNDKVSTLEDLLISVNEGYHSKQYFSNFACENTDRIKWDFVEQMMKDCKVLVIIGYSFPKDNIRVDNKIMEMASNAGVEKIYYQNLVDDRNALKKFDLPVDAEFISDCDTFYIPDEFYIEKKEPAPVKVKLLKRKRYV